MGVVIGIDASNIRDGGGITHLSYLLRGSKFLDYGIEQVTVWSGQHTLSQLPHTPSVDHCHDSALDGALPRRLAWQVTRLPSLLRRGIDLLFVPGGTYLTGFTPTVVMAQNLLPFDRESRSLYGGTPMAQKLKLLALTQGTSLRRANGVVFVSDSSRHTIETFIGRTVPAHTVVPHGVSREYFHAPRVQKAISDYSLEHPFTWLYVSRAEPYKHHREVVRAVLAAREEGYPVALRLLTWGRKERLRKLDAMIAELDPAGATITTIPPVPSAEMPRIYAEADGFVFASTCETFGNVVLEAMAAGLPIASSGIAPMRELLGNDALYFDAFDYFDICRAIACIVRNRDFRVATATALFQRAHTFDWERSSDRTWSFLASVAHGGEP
jgi:glycosyltransferase involved in cell wall biosynthesis